MTRLGRDSSPRATGSSQAADSQRVNRAVGFAQAQSHNSTGR
ncbi:unnamed protein product [Protopolystoma xenopodis]|uniref:Uncharacterized protein n=1 Tax=Protopolystoma xenopodis TaxID=117903 RepID=A0A448X9K2_9PLAT|nr:unnamed protein product [Protopolystoma xenopodis]